MSTRKGMVLATAGATLLGLTSVFAVGTAPMTRTITAKYSSAAYVDLGVGYADYHKPESSITNHTDIKNYDGGFGFQGDVGYNFINHLSVELGAGYLPTYSFTTNGSSQKSKQWFADTAVKLDFNLVKNIDVFMKAGIAYRSSEYDMANNPTSVNGNATITTVQPMFGAGIAYQVNNNLSVMARYLHLAPDTASTNQYTGDDATIKTQARNILYKPVDLFSLGVGYKFSI